LISWIPSYSEFQELFFNEFSLKILASLAQHENMRICAAELAAVLEIHISTAKKYLDLLHKYNFVDKELIATKPGKPTYYTLKTTDVKIILDFDKLSQSLQADYTISDIVIREKKGIYPQIKFVFGDEKIISAILIRKRTNTHRLITQRLELTTIESEFLKYLPFASMPPESFLKICNKAQVIVLLTLNLFIFLLKN
jgi:hypothetical protein